MDSKQILALEFHSNDLDKDITVKDFMKELLSTLFKEMECFSGKRPFGNSGWEYDMAICFVKNKIISGTIEDLGDGDIDIDFDSNDFDKMIQKIISDL